MILLRSPWIHAVIVAFSVARATPMLAQQSAGSSQPSLDSATLAANRRVDQAFLDAHAAKNSAAVVRLFSRRTDIVFVAPNGVINHGRAEILASFNLLFPHITQMHGQIRNVTYVRVSDGVVTATGTEVFSRQRKDGVTDERTVVWTDVRVLEDGEWRYVTRHSHWPAPPDAQSAPGGKR
jgi:uncharacterized protein (TIGR02246 family)